jgi:hypothetical protein
MRICRPLTFLLSFVCLWEYCHAGDLSSPRVVVFHGEKFYEASDLSAVALVGNHLVVGSDEGHVIQILKTKSPDAFELVRKYSLPDGQETDETEKEDPEIDFEGIAADGNVVYIVGSHSRKRKKVEVRNPDRRSHDKNRERLSEIEPEAARRALFRVTLDADGKLVGAVEKKDLSGAINKFETELKPFAQIPSKENGIDIEGIAVQGNDLYIGFRGPVLRENWVPVMVTQFENPADHPKLLYVNLGGLGIRDMVAVGDDQFLIIAGPMGDGPGGYHLYSWNGKDCVPGKNGAKGVVRNLGEIPTDTGAKAEGITLLSSDQDDPLRLLIVFDGPERGDPISLMLRK